MIGEGIKSTNQRKHSYVQDHVEVGFFTDPSVCIGCKACEVACKEWNQVPDDGLTWSGNSYDNTGHLGASTWRHVMFLEQDRQSMIGEFFRVAHASRVLVSASRRSRLLLHEHRKKSLRWRDAIANTRDACATQSTELRVNV